MEVPFVGAMRRIVGMRFPLYAVTMAESGYPNAVALEAQGITLEKQAPSDVYRVIKKVNGYDLAVNIIEARGQQLGTALLMPGYTSSLETFNMLLGPLADRGYKVVTYSHRGQPYSQGPDEYAGYTLKQFAADTHGVAEALGLGNDIHLLGHSFGGVVAVDAVLQNPDRFASLTMWNSGPSAIGSSLQAWRDGFDQLGPRFYWIADCQEKGIDPAIDQGEMNPVLAYYHRRLFSTKPAQLDAGIDILMNQVDRVGEIAATGIPVLVSHGANDDAWPHSEQQRMARQTRGEYWVLAGAGHSAQADRSWASAQLLATFWDDHNAEK
jgi:pimeloyl-ACP methyl ester carboxylesterase